MSEDLQDEDSSIRPSYMPKNYEANPDFRGNSIQGRPSKKTPSLFAKLFFNDYEELEERNTPGHFSAANSRKAAIDFAPPPPPEPVLVEESIEKPPPIHEEKRAAAPPPQRHPHTPSQRSSHRPTPSQQQSYHQPTPPRMSQHSHYSEIMGERADLGYNPPPLPSFVLVKEIQKEPLFEQFRRTGLDQPALRMSQVPYNTQDPFRQPLFMVASRVATEQMNASRAASRKSSFLEKNAIDAVSVSEKRQSVHSVRSNQNIFENVPRHLVEKRAAQHQSGAFTPKLNRPNGSPEYYGFPEAHPQGIYGNDRANGVPNDQYANEMRRSEIERRSQSSYSKQNREMQVPASGYSGPSGQYNPGGADPRAFQFSNQMGYDGDSVEKRNYFQDQRPISRASRQMGSETPDYAYGFQPMHQVFQNQMSSIPSDPSKPEKVHLFNPNQESRPSYTPVDFSAPFQDKNTLFFDNPMGFGSIQNQELRPLGSGNNQLNPRLSNYSEAQMPNPNAPVFTQENQYGVAQKGSFFPSRGSASFSEFELPEAPLRPSNIIVHGNTIQSNSHNGHLSQYGGHPHGNVYAEANRGSNGYGFDLSMEESAIHHTNPNFYNQRPEMTQNEKFIRYNQ